EDRGLSKQNATTEGLGRGQKHRVSYSRSGPPTMATASSGPSTCGCREATLSFLIWPGVTLARYPCPFSGGANAMSFFTEPPLGFASRIEGTGKEKEAGGRRHAKTRCTMSGRRDVTCQSESQDGAAGLGDQDPHAEPVRLSRSRAHTTCGLASSRAAMPRGGRSYHVLVLRAYQMLKAEVTEGSYGLAAAPSTLQGRGWWP
ncbi:hypothetical protein GQ53DRAFT_866299, partial [Thozetella sp. PMI_491]